MSILQAVSPEQFRTMPWANGGGTTTELAAGPDPADWRWRISLARIDADGAFSALPGVRRWLAPLDGGLRLEFADGRSLAARRLQVLRFDGDPPPDCHLPDGAGRDFNLMLREGMDGDLVVRPLNGNMVLLPGAGTCWFVYLLAGRATLAADGETVALEPGHAAWARPQPGQRVSIDGGGEIALVRLTEQPHFANTSGLELEARTPVTDWLLPYARTLPRRSLADIDLVVIHCTELPDLATAREYGERALYEDGSGNSGHYYVDRDGRVSRFVDDHHVAHHTRGYNQRSVGIELVNVGRYPHWLDSRHQQMTEPYPPEQIESLLALLAQLRRELPGLRFIAGHEDLDTGCVTADDDPSLQVRRKRDPGPMFPWEEVMQNAGLLRLGGPEGREGPPSE